MNKIKVIDLLNMISKGEEVPKKIKVFGGEFEFLYQSGDRTYFDYDGDYLFSDEYDWENNLNNEVEIIEEEKEIEKIESSNLINTRDILELEMIINKKFADYTYKINELIDVVNGLKRDKEC